jgi:2'-5' RNA ligase
VALASDEPWRLFVALPVPDGERARLHTALAPYRQAFGEVRWLEPESWHVTLVFIGRTRTTSIPALVGACTEVAAAWQPFEIDLASGSGSVRRGDGVAWLAIRTNAGRAIALADDLRLAIDRDVRGIGEPRRAISAHLTVARRADERLVAAIRSEALGPLRAAWTADRLVLTRSHLGRAGASYEALHVARLAGPPSP